MTTGASSDTRYGREQAWHLLTEWTQSESLRKHALAVEACVVAYGEQEAGSYLATPDRGMPANEPRLLRRKRTDGHFARSGGDKQRILLTYTMTDRARDRTL